jgi:ribosomal protein L24E
MRSTLLLLFLCTASLAQTTINGARTITGALDASGSPMVRVRVGSGAPSSGSCDSAGEVGSLYVRSDAETANASLYVCSKTGASAYAWELAQGSGGGGGGGGGAGEWSGTIDFAAIPDGSCRQDTYTATGATAGTVVAQGLPAALAAGLVANSWVSATNTITVRVCNFSGAEVDPASAAFKARTVSGYLSGSGTIDFATIPDFSCREGPVTVTGAAVGDHVAAGWPAAMETGLVGAMFVSASDTVTVRLCNFSGAEVDPASATFRAAIIK